MADILTLDALMTQLGECESSILKVAERVAKRVKSEYGLKVDDAEYVTKDPVSEVTAKGDPKVDRTITSYITTITKDRDNEIVLPEGMIQDDYKSLPVVLFGHQYGNLGVGRNLWIVPTDKRNIDLMYGHIAKTQYASEKANPFSEQLLNWRMEDMPMGESIGFVPVESITPDDSKEWKKLYDGVVGRITGFLKSKGREVTEDQFEDIRRIYTKWILLEYSDVMVPSNPHAVQLAVQKGLTEEAVLLGMVEKDEIDKYVIKQKDDADAAPEAAAVVAQDAEDEKPDDTPDKAKKYECECIDCGLKLKTDKHCKDLKCEKCGGEMRRVERPGPGTRGFNLPEFTLEQLTALAKLLAEKFDVEGNAKQEEPDTQPESIVEPDDLPVDEQKDETKALAAELKEGRVLSEKNRGQIRKCVDSIAETATMLSALYEATEPKREEEDAEPLEEKDAEIDFAALTAEILGGMKKPITEDKPLGLAEIPTAQEIIDLAKGRLS